MMIRFFFLTLLMLFSVGLITPSAFAQSEAFVCITGQHEGAGDDMSMDETGRLDPFPTYDDLYQPAAMSCKDIQAIELGLSAMRLTMMVGSIGMACSGIGAPASVALQSGTVGILFVELVVGNLPCEDHPVAPGYVDQEKMEASMKQVVCSALTQQGIECNVDTLQVEGL